MEKVIFDDSPSMRSVDRNGFLHVKTSHISKATVNPYLGREIPNWEEMKLDPDRIYYGLRDPEELRKAAHTFNGLPILLNHHEESAEAPQKEYRVGSTGTDAVFDGEYLNNSLSITDQTAIDLINSGEMKELSCSYYFTPDFVSGEYKGMPFDFIMRNISGNHVALVNEGRAGHDVAVADSKKNLGGNMAKRKAVQDANPAIEASEVSLANWLKCIQAVEAQQEGIDPKSIGLEGVTMETTPEEIVDMYMTGLDPETRAHKIAKLKHYAGYEETGDSSCGDGEPVVVQAQENTGDEEPVASATPAVEETAPAVVQEDDLDERMKDPAFREGYEAGVLYGERREKANPKRIDRDHEREGEERYLEKVGDSVSNIKVAAKKEALQEMRAHFKELSKAATECRSYIGTRDPMAFDSADEIYGIALKQMGQDIKNVPKSAYRYMFYAAEKASGTRRVSPAMDSALDDEISEDLDKLLN